MYCNVCFYSLSICILMLCSTTHSAQGNKVFSNQGYDFCGPRNFQCDSGQCISDHDQCDGKADCRDNSDETEKACFDIHCPKFIYRCNYGACVKARAKCDGVRDCFDGSDEASCGIETTTSMFTPFTTRRRPVLLRPVNCAMPNDPENGIYTIGGKSPDAYIAGEIVPPFSVLVTNCDSGYQTMPPEAMYSVCANGIWTPIPSTCSSSSQSTSAARPVQCQCYC